MVIDLHVHVSEYSPDSHCPVRDAVARARAIGLDGICVTDHDSLGILEIIDSLRAETGFPIFAGAEYLTTDGDVLVFGLDRLPPPGLSASELAGIVWEAGGASVACHPYRRNNRGLGDRLFEVARLTAVECFNGSTGREHNLQAEDAARRLNLPCTGASDAHHAERIGRFATRFAEPVRTEADLIRQLREKKVRPCMYVDGAFINISETLYYRETPAGDREL